LAHVGDVTHLAISRDGPEEKAPFVEYDLIRREWGLVDPTKGGFSGDPRAVVIPIVEAKELNGKVGGDKENPRRIVSFCAFSLLFEIISFRQNSWSEHVSAFRAVIYVRVSYVLSAIIALLTAPLTQ